MAILDQMIIEQSHSNLEWINGEDRSLGNKSRQIQEPTEERGEGDLRVGHSGGDN
jgi:hypothetical protein